MAILSFDEYEALGQTDDEISLLIEHDKWEDLHAFTPGRNATPSWQCHECGDTAEGLMHNNTWRNVEPLIGD